VATFTVTRSGGTAAFDVNYATSNGSATVADGDYVASSNVLQFGANQNTQTISVTITGDTKVEANETFNVGLTNATNGASISDSQGVGTITNDDGAVSQIVGTLGGDVIPGTAGADTLQGLTGDDTYTVNNAGDIVIEAANAGTDKVEAWVSYTLPDNVDILQLMGTGALNGTGNALNNIINGNNATNVLSGGGGNDTLDGRGGIDTLFGGAGGDTFVFGDKTQADGDKVMDFVHGVDKLDFHLIDARENRSGDQAFRFDGYSAGNHRNGDLWLTENQAANVTHVYADTGPTVFHVDLIGTHLGLTASDFIL
jgi:Ca2+-binding RTX toxin-like protein